MRIENKSNRAIILPVRKSDDLVFGGSTDTIEAKASANVPDWYFAAVSGERWFGAMKKNGDIAVVNTAASEEPAKVEESAPPVTKSKR